MRRSTILMQLGFVVSLLVSLSGPSNSQTITVDSYLHPENAEEKTLFEMYLAGVKDGLQAHHVVEHAENPAAKRLYCFPENIVLKTEQADEIIRRWAKEHKDSNTAPIGVALLLGLQQDFPCTR